MGAAPGEKKVFARAPGRAVQLKLARVGRRFRAHPLRGEREAHEPLGAPARGEERVSHLLIALPRDALEKSFDLDERRGERTLGALDLRLGCRTLVVIQIVIDAASRIRSEHEEGGRGPCERGERGGREGARAARRTRMEPHE